MNFLPAFATLCVIALKLQTGNTNDDKQFIAKEIPSLQEILKTLSRTKSKISTAVSIKRSPDKETTVIITDTMVKPTKQYQHKRFETRNKLHLSDNVYKDETELPTHPFDIFSIMHSKNMKSIINRIKLKKKQVALNQYISKYNKVFLLQIDRVSKDRTSFVYNSTNANSLKLTKRSLKLISGISSKPQYFNTFSTDTLPSHSITRNFTIGNTGRTIMSNKKINNANYVSTTEGPNPNTNKSKLSKTEVAAIVSGIIAMVGFTGAAIFSCSKHNCLRSEERQSLIK